MSFAIPYMVLDVALEPPDGEPVGEYQWTVATDQRDQRRAFVACGIADPEADKIGFLMAVAWAACQRTGVVTDVSWPDWQARCYYTGLHTNGDEAPTVDPTTAGGAV